MVLFFKGMSPLVLARYLMGIILLLALGTQVKTLEAASLKNSAVLELLLPWSNRATPILDPPCYAGKTAPHIQHYLAKSMTLNSMSQPLTHLGRVFWLEGRCVDAIETWKQAWKTGDLPAGFELYRRGEYAPLSLEARRALSESAYWYAVSLTESAENVAAYPWFERAYRLVPEQKTAEMVVYWGRMVGSELQAESVWEEMVSLQPPTSSDYWWAVGRLHALEGHWAAAADAYEHGAMLADAAAAFWIEAGRGWEYAADWNRALEAFQHAYEVSPNDVRAYWGLGTAYRGQQDYRQALDWYERASRVQPHDPLSFFYLGLTHYKMGDYDLARHSLEMALELDPVHTISMDMLAQVYYAEGDFDLAERWLVMAIQHSSIAPIDLWLRLGDWRLEWEDCLGSQEAYLQALNAGADEMVIQQRLNALLDACNSPTGYRTYQILYGLTCSFFSLV